MRAEGLQDVPISLCFRHAATALLHRAITLRSSRGGVVGSQRLVKWHRGVDSSASTSQPQVLFPLSDKFLWPHVPNIESVEVKRQDGFLFPPAGQNTVRSRLLVHSRTRSITTNSED